MSYREIEKRLRGTRHAISHTRVGQVVKAKPVGEGKRDQTIRVLAVFHGKGRGKAYLTKLAKHVGLRSEVVREWLALPPGPDYVNERAARQAARAARRPRDPVVTAIRRILRELRQPSAAMLAEAFPDVDVSVIKEQIEWKRKNDARGRFWAARNAGMKRKEGGTRRSEEATTRQERRSTSAQKELDLDHVEEGT